MLTLGIETTCDETAASIVVDGKNILSNIVASQQDLHAIYGGVFPELACRRHSTLLYPIIQEAVAQAGLSSLQQIDLISVAKGPGLIGALLIGLNGAKALSLGLKKPFVGVNHVEAHLYACFMQEKPILLPAMGLVASGGHTFLIEIREVGTYRMLGQTCDDAIGEAFDKVAHLLGLPYPGGPAIEALAATCQEPAAIFKTPHVKNDPWAFSFSGLKTAVRYAIQEQLGRRGGDPLSDSEKAAIAWAFQETALNSLCEKIQKGVETFHPYSLLIGGGVSANQLFRKKVAELALSIPTYWPPAGLSGDNAAMIAGLGAVTYAREGACSMGLEPLSRIPL